MKRLIDEGEVKMGLVLPWDFSKTIKAGEGGSYSGVDGWNRFKYSQYYSQLCPGDCPTIHSGKDHSEGRADGCDKPESTHRGRPRVWFNEDLESKNYFVPGLVAVIMSIIGVLLTGQVIVREWEKGNDGTPHLHSCSKRGVDDRKVVSLFFLRSS